MGRLIYDHFGNSVDLDDRVLAHLQIAIGTKLRRGEPFFFTWHVSSGIDGQRNSAWISPRSPLTFRFNGGRNPAVNPHWVEALIREANTAHGLRVVAEPEHPSVTTN